ncbi:MAG: glycerol-3-phosphate 1-O-acyltransferase PlsY [Candidatus Magnetominusculus sp. LBB02]|nr:glycerol-3-phosphate 1-O-acyltransferase PlsY [Candidatus Magnetominusculus sp. LBB02]
MIVLCILGAFILGSVPFGLIVARTKGVDIKKTGSGNIGATNVLRSVGKWAALCTLLGDMLKGALAVIIARYLSMGETAVGLIGVFAILGHDFSVFSRFKGGKGVATSLGVLLVYSPAVGAVTAAVWLIALSIWKYSSLSALLAFLVVPVNIYLFDYSPGKLIYGLIIMLLIVYKHKDNIERLISGTEPGIKKK